MLLWVANTHRLKGPKDFIKSMSPMIEKMEEFEVVKFLASKIYKNYLTYFPSIPISKDQIIVVAENIYDCFGALKLNEIDYFFKRVAQGDYGPVYNNLDPATILTKLRLYERETAKLATAYRDSDHKANKGIRSGSELSEMKKVDARYLLELKQKYKNK